MSSDSLQKQSGLKEQRTITDPFGVSFEGGSLGAQPRRVSLFKRQAGRARG